MREVNSRRLESSMFAKQRGSGRSKTAFSRRFAEGKKGGAPPVDSNASEDASDECD